MARQLEMLEKPKRKRVFRAHLYDAGHTQQFFVCMCGWKSGWITALPVRDARRGIPCPKCNQPEKPEN